MCGPQAVLYIPGLCTQVKRHTHACVGNAPFFQAVFPIPPHSFLHFITSGSLRTGYENKGPFVPLRTALYNFFFLPNYVSSSHSGNEFPSPPSSKRKGGNPPALPPPTSSNRLFSSLPQGPSFLLLLPPPAAPQIHPILSSPFSPPFPNRTLSSCDTYQ